MENINFEGVNLAELLPRIPESVKNGLPFGIVKMDLVGTILEYNMAEGELTGVDPKWAIGKNFFDDVAMCTKTQAFYGRFVEGVKKGFLNVVFEYVFDHQQNATKVKIHMFTLPDSSGKKTVILLVKRSNKPLVIDAIPAAIQTTITQPKAVGLSVAGGVPSVQDAVNAIMTAMNQAVPNSTPSSADLQANTHTATTSNSRHQDILKF
jgi:photoactive yellow protein